MHHGLFEVVPGVYQVRGLDIANMTLIEGDSGVIVVDTLTSIEGARAAMELYFQHRGKRPVAAVIFTHTHTDHWGGARGVLDDETLASGKVPIIAPNFFMEHAVSENIIAGPAMLRRAQYQFGPFLAKGVRGQVDCGLGKSMAAGSVALLRPTDLIIATGDKRIIDGLEFEFQMAPNSEAPAEMHFFVPRYKLLNLAENCTHNFHNLLPFRGADVRDALAWSKYLGEALQMWGGKADAMCGQHHWPVWGQRADRHHDPPAARPLQIRARPDHPPDEPRAHRGRDRRDDQAACEPRRRLAWARLLRPHPAQCEGDLPEISRLVRRQSRSISIRCRRSSPARNMSSIWAARTRSSTRAAQGFRQGRIPLRGAGRQPSGVRRSRQSGGARDAGGYVRAARLCRRKFDLAQRLSVRRAGVAAGHAEDAAAPADAARNAGRVAHRAAMGRARRPPQWPQGRRQAHRAELEFYRHRRDLYSQSRELRADLYRGRAGGRCAMRASRWRAACSTR